MHIKALSKTDSLSWKTNSHVLPSIYIDRLDGVRPIVINDHTTARIIDTIASEKVAYLKALQSARLSISPYALSNPFSNWYKIILNEVYTTTSDTTFKSLSSYTSNASFALPIVSIHTDLSAKKLKISMRPPLLWMSTAHYDNIACSDLTHQSLFLIIPTSQKSFWGAVIPQEQKKDFQKLMLPKVFFD